MKKILDFFTQTWIGSFGLVFSIYFFVIQHFIVPSPSMEKTMLVGDIFFAKKFSYGIPIPRLPFLEIALLPDFNNNGHILKGDGPEKGDVVVFRYMKNEKMYFVKRCIATEGDEVIYYDKNLLIHSKNKDFMKNNNTISFNNKLWVVNPYKDNGSNYINNIDKPEDSSFNQLLNSEKPIDMIQKTDSKLGTYFYKKISNDSYYMMGDNRNNSYDSRFFGEVNYKYIVGQAFFTFFSFSDKTRSFSFIK